jgi:hypothetical protein
MNERDLEAAVLRALAHASGGVGDRPIEPDRPLAEQFDLDAERFFGALARETGIDIPVDDRPAWRPCPAAWITLPAGCPSSGSAPECRRQTRAASPHRACRAPRGGAGHGAAHPRHAHSLRSRPDSRPGAGPRRCDRGADRRLHRLGGSARGGAARWSSAACWSTSAVDAIVGAVPGLGTIFDVAFKAHRRNATMLADWAHSPAAVEARQRRLLLAVAGLVVALLLIAAAALALRRLGTIEPAGLDLGKAAKEGEPWAHKESAWMSITRSGIASSSSRRW